MSKTSKTARASMGVVVKEKKVIPDEVYIKNLRIDLESGLYVAQEGARALLRAYDTALANSAEQVLATNTERERANGAEEALTNKVLENEALYKSNLALDAELKAALSQIETLTKELDAPVEVIEGAVDWELKKEGDFIG